MKMGGAPISWATSILTVVIAFSLSCSCFTTAEAYQHHRHSRKGNITIKWDALSWTPDGYVAVVTIYNFQKHCRIEAPGWRLGWTWARHEIIWAMVGGQALEQGDCSRFKGNIPHSCKKSPTIMDLKPGTPFNQQIANCCRGGVLSSWFQHRANSISSFQISVGQAGTTNATVKLPIKFMFKAPQDVYTCGPARVVRPTRFITPDKRRVTQALMTWKVTCSYNGTRSKIDGEVAPVATVRDVSMEYRGSSTSPNLEGFEVQS